MNINQQKFNFHKRQQGFVLILVLVMLAVLTLIGVSSMNSSNMELKSIANSKQHAIAFNVVQSVIEFSVSADGDALIDFQINDPDITQTVVTGDLSVDDGTAYSAGIVFSGCGVASGNSLSKGFSYNFFDVTATGKNKTAGGLEGKASSTQTQGIRFPAASC